MYFIQMMNDSDYDRIFALKDEGKSLSVIGETVGMDWRRVKRILDSRNKERREYRPNSLNDPSKWDAIKERIEELYAQNKKIFTHSVIEDIEKKFGEKVSFKFRNHKYRNPKCAVELFMYFCK